MKRIGAIICLTAFIMTMTMGFAFAADSGLKVESVYPENEAKNMAMDNMGFKVYFNENVYSKENKEANQKLCRIVDNKGKEIPTIVLFSPKEKKLMMVLADTNSKKLRVKGKTKYTVQVDEGFVAANGDTLSKQFTSSFETLNPKSSMWISMGMMGVMVVVMVFATKKGLTDENKRREEREKERAREEKRKVNPYKVAKETGKSVEEVVAKDEKRKAKIAAKNEKRQAKEAEVLFEDDDITKHHVKKKQAISELGMTYSKPKPKQEAKPKQGGQNQKKKGSKQSQKKKKKKK